MEQGGNAIDALVAGAFTACVTEQASCGLGGYAHISLWLADPGEFLMLRCGGKSGERRHDHGCAHPHPR